MKVKYYPEDDFMSLKMSDAPYDYAEKIGSFIVHYSSDKEPVMLEILNASQFLRETIDALPYPMVDNIFHRHPMAA